MMLLKELQPEIEQALRRRFPRGRLEQWATNLAAKRGWKEANRRFLEATRKRGVEEMTALLAAMDISEASSTKQAFDLIRLAHAVFLPEAQVDWTRGHRAQPVLRIRVRDCPTFACLEQSGWHGVTACSAWHRRSGWYQALGLRARDTVLAEKKWGDQACLALVEATEDEAVPVANSA